MSSVLTKFERIGAKAVVQDVRDGEQFSIDVRGGTFAIRKPPEIALEVLDFDAFDRHLLLLTRGPEKARFLCGHDERHWFVAAIPESSPVTTVEAAKEALKPEEILGTERGLGKREKNLRRNERRIRQGEWFFIPTPGFVPPKGTIILKNEPLGRMRNGRFISRPHLCTELVRFGGENIFLPRVQLPTRDWRDWRQVPRARQELQARLEQEVGTGLTAAERDVYIERHPEAREWQWESFVRNPEVYVRGRVKHPDHKVLRLKVWHKVVQNTELRAKAMSYGAFID